MNSILEHNYHNTYFLSSRLLIKNKISVYNWRSNETQTLDNCSAEFQHIDGNRVKVYTVEESFAHLDCISVIRNINTFPLMQKINRVIIKKYKWQSSLLQIREEFKVFSISVLHIKCFYLLLVYVTFPQIF